MKGYFDGPCSFLKALMERGLRLFEKGFSVFALMIYSGGLLSLIRSGGASEGETDFLVQSDSSLTLAIFQMIYVVTFILLALRWKKVVALLLQDKFIWILILLSALSVLWSSDPKVTMVRVIALIGTSLFGVYLASRYSLREQLVILALTFGCIMALSLVLAILVPQYGIMAGIHTGAWRGIYNHKNVLGKMMVLSAFVFLLRANFNIRNRSSFLGLCISIFLLFLSRSSAAIASFAILLTVFLVLRMLRWQYEVMIPMLLAALATGFGAFILIVEHADSLLLSVGKDPTLTGRTDLWWLVLDQIWEHPWLGYGYGAFWEDSNSGAVLIRYAVGWGIPNGHNGFLDLWADLGLVGVFILLLGTLGTMIRALLLLRSTKNLIYIWPLLFVTNMLLANLAETTLMVRNDIFWVIYVAVALSVINPEEIEAHEGWERT